MASSPLTAAIDDLFDEEANGITTVSELARRMHEIAPRQNAESWRKSVRRWRREPYSEEDIQVLTQAFNVPRARFPEATAKARRGETGRRLQQLEAEVDLWKAVLLEALTLLDLQVNPEADPGSRVSTRTPGPRPGGTGRAHTGT